MRPLIDSFRPAVGWMLLGMFLSLLSVLANIALLTLSSWFIAATAMAGVTGALFNYLLPSVGVRAFALFRTGGRYLERLVTHNATFRILTRLKRTTYERFATDYRTGIRLLHSGDAAAPLQHDIDALQSFYTRGLVPVAVATLGGGGTVLFVAHYSAVLAAALACLLVLVGVVVPSLERAAARRAVHNRAELRTKLREKCVELVSGMTELVQAGALGRFTDELTHLSEQETAEKRKLDRGAAIWEAVTVAGSGAAVVAAFLVAVPLIRGGELPAAHAAMLTVCALVSFETVLPLRDAMVQLAATRQAAKRVFGSGGGTGGGAGSGGGGAVVNAPGATDPHKPDRAAGAVETDAVAAPPPHIALDAVTLRYPGAPGPALDGVSLELPPQTTRAIVGPVGSGKSSILNVLAGLAAPNGGAVEPVPSLLSSELAVLEQHPHIFDASVRDNLLLGDPDATEEDLRFACDTAHFTAVLDSLPDGVETQLGRGGARLSAGEQKRLALARTLLRPASTILLDEPTEHLDQALERSLLDSILAWAAEKTLLVVTHRLVSMDRFDRIFVMDTGRIVESGTHQELLAAGGLYTGMWNMLP